MSLAQIYYGNKAVPEYAVKLRDSSLFEGTLTECMLWLADSFGNQSVKFLMDRDYKIEKAA